MRGSLTSKMQRAVSSAQPVDFRDIQGNSYEERGGARRYRHLPVLPSRTGVRRFGRLVTQRG